MSGKRRQNREGTYYEKGEGADKRFFYQAPRIQGTKYRPSVSAKTKAELRIKKRELDARLERDAPLDSSTTLNEFLDRYFENQAKDIARERGRIRPSTHTRNVNNVKFLRTVIGETKLDTLRLQQVERAYRAMGDAISPLTGRPYSVGTIQRAHAVLHTAMKKAVAWELIDRNPCTGAELPQEAKREIHFLTLDEVQRVLALPDRLHALWHLLILTGLRIGEARALQWSDYHDGIITVSATLLDVGGPHPGPPKSKNAYRDIPVDADLAESLAQHRTAQKREKLAAGPLWKDTGYIFTGTAGEPLWSTVASKYWARALAKVTDKHVTPHGLRHTAAMLNISYLNTPDYELSKRMGHANATITRNVYGHLREDAHQDTSDRMGRLLRGEG